MTLEQGFGADGASTLREDTPRVPSIDSDIFGIASPEAMLSQGEKQAAQLEEIARLNAEIDKLTLALTKEGEGALNSRVADILLESLEEMGARVQELQKLHNPKNLIGTTLEQEPEQNQAQDDVRMETVSEQPKKTNPFLEQVERDNKPLDALRRELHHAEAEELAIRLKMGLGEYDITKLNDLSEIAKKIQALKTAINNHQDSKVFRVDYIDPNRKDPGPRGFEYLPNDDQKFHDRNKAA